MTLGGGLITVGLLLKQPAVLSLLSFGVGILVFGHAFGRTR